MKRRLHYRRLWYSISGALVLHGVFFLLCGVFSDVHTERLSEQQHCIEVERVYYRRHDTAHTIKNNELPDINNDAFLTTEAALTVTNYRKIIEGIIKSTIHYPTIARERAIEGSAQVEILVKRNGTLDAYTIIKSSGSMLLDGEIHRVLRRIHKNHYFPPVPNTIPDVKIPIQLNIIIAMKLK